MPLLRLFSGLIAVFALVIGGLFVITKPYNRPPDEIYKEDHYWGRTKWKPGEIIPKDDDSIRTFKINVSHSALEDLKQRLKRTRLQDSLPGTNFYYGMRSEVLKEFIDYWINSYDWSKEENYLNSFPQFKTQVEGLDIHFIHVKSANANAIPLMLVHGWSGSYFELLKMVLLLRNDFDIVIPSLPGNSFSEASHKPGLSTYHIARMFKKLMNRLGYERFIYHGGDWGAIIGRSLARTFPESVFGLHTTMPTGPFTGQGLARIFLSNLGFGSFVFRDKMEISRWHDLPGIFKNLLEESGYFHEQATKPDTIGVALNNDPAGLAAYILEKFSTLVKRENVLKSDGGLKDTFTKDELITNVMLYWINGCITSSIRIYKEAFLISILDRGAVTVPACAIVAKNEIDSIVTPTLMQESYWDVVNYTMLDRGGHYLAFEEPQVVAQDIINFSKILKTRSSK